eukprot:1893736-Rhodomonas_salina.1
MVCHRCSPELASSQAEIKHERLHFQYINQELKTDRISLSNVKLSTVHGETCAVCHDEASVPESNYYPRAPSRGFIANTPRAPS